MNKKATGVLKIAAVTIYILFIFFFFDFINELDRQLSSYMKTEASDQPTKVIPGWKYHWGDSPLNSDGSLQWLNDEISEDEWVAFQFPGRPKNRGRYNAIWIRTTLPAVSYRNPYFMFRSTQQVIEVYLEDQLIYQYGSYTPSEKVRTPGSTWHFAKLPSDFGGKTISIRLRSPFPDYIGYFTEIAIGNRDSHYLDIFKGNTFRLIFGFIFITIGAAILLIQLFGARNWHNFKYLGLTSIFLGGWYITDSRVIQLLFSIPVSVIYAANFFIFFVPIWLLIYVERTYTIKSSLLQRLLRLQWILHSLLSIMAFAGDMSGLISSLYFVNIFHIMLVITTVLLTVTIIKAAIRGRKGAVLFISGILVFCITGLYDTFIMFYDHSPLYATVRTSYLGMLYFLLTMIANAGKDLKALYDGLESDSRENKTNYKSLFANMTDGFLYNRIEYNQEGKIIGCTILEINAAIIEMTGFRKDELIGSNILTLFPEIKTLNLNICQSSLEPVDTRAQSWIDDAIRFRDRWYRISAFSPKKGFLGFIFSDVTVIKNAEETIRRQAYTDSMTGFFNRTYFEDVMSTMNGMMDVLNPLSIIAIDIDGLKITNDTFGHNVGDDLLKEAARILTQVFKGSAIITRVGGDEFCIILPNTTANMVRDFAEQIVKMTEETNCRNPVAPISMSIGIATSNEEEEESIYNIYRRADDDMYHYKLSQSSSEKSKVIDMLLTALSERDYVSQGHVERISELCIRLSEALNLHDNQKRNLVLLSKVHDLGKIGIPDDILNKPDKLTSKEYEKMKMHVKIGYNIASRSKELVGIAPLILHHHEHWNGMGYPDSLKGTDIPLECRILAIIDAFDAMTNDRPYHKGISLQSALQEIERCIGEQFDPDLARKFIDIIMDYQHEDIGEMELSS